jgi:chemotaxis protein MotB
MARKPRPVEKKKKDNSERWLLTYADMITLLMVFFIMLYAMSNPSQSKMQQASEAFANIFGNAQISPFVSPTGAGTGVMTGVTPGQKVTSNRGGKSQGTGGASTVATNAVSRLQNLIKSGQVRVIPTENGFAISLASDLYFGTASATLSQAAMPVLQQVADFLGQIPNSVVVEGYTDNIAPTPDKWADNYHLASARSLAVLNTLQDYGIPAERLSSQSFGEQRPVQSNDTAEGRAYNRRVDIVIVDQQ